MSPGSERKVSRASAKTFEREITKNRIVALFFFHGVEKTGAIDGRENGPRTGGFTANGSRTAGSEPAR